MNKLSHEHGHGCWCEWTDEQLRSEMGRRVCAAIASAPPGITIDEFQPTLLRIYKIFALERDCALTTEEAARVVDSWSAVVDRLMEAK
jgi:hypothetical protein